MAHGVETISSLLVQTVQDSLIKILYKLLCLFSSKHNKQNNNYIVRVISLRQNPVCHPFHEEVLQ